jgi:hypothetical protein
MRKPNHRKGRGKAKVKRRRHGGTGPARANNEVPSTSLRGKIASTLALRAKSSDFLSRIFTGLGSSRLVMIVMVIAVLVGASEALRHNHGNDLVEEAGKTVEGSRWWWMGAGGSLVNSQQDAGRNRENALAFDEMAGVGTSLLRGADEQSFKADESTDAGANQQDAFATKTTLPASIGEAVHLGVDANHGAMGVARSDLAGVAFRETGRRLIDIGACNGQPSKSRRESLYIGLLYLP